MAPHGYELLLVIQVASTFLTGPRVRRTATPAAVGPARDERSEWSFRVDRCYPGPLAQGSDSFSYKTHSSTAISRKPPAVENWLKGGGRPDTCRLWPVDHQPPAPPATQTPLYHRFTAYRCWFVHLPAPKESKNISQCRAASHLPVWIEKFSVSYDPVFTGVTGF